MSQHFFKYHNGNRIKLIDNVKFYPMTGIITGCYFELGRNVYDFVDSYGNPRWCYEEQIIYSIP